MLSNHLTKIKKKFLNIKKTNITTEKYKMKFLFSKLIILE